MKSKQESSPAKKEAAGIDRKDKTGKDKGSFVMLDEWLKLLAYIVL
ncbi:MAG: hypothetical protein GX813_03635 [Erysipelotrichia bacterium]|nr:hypothetical protein [Erysipelotrichia bacterium]